MVTGLFLSNYALEELKDLFSNKGIESFRAKQVADWVYKKFVFCPDEMTNLPEDVKKFLAAELPVVSSRIKKVFESKTDASSKFLVQLNDGEHIETVLMPEKTGLTICISTQVGCPVQCVFCASGMLGLKRNLSAGEIVEQILLVNHYCRDTPWRVSTKNNTNRFIYNIVIMGMGEPLLNVDNLIKALEIITARWGLHFGLNRITLSTAICAEEALQKLVQAGLAPNLAVSLHTADDELRRQLVPHCKLDIHKIIENALRFRNVTKKNLTFEYVLLHGMNSSIADAKKLVHLLKPLKVKVNLIMFNSVKGSKFSSPEKEDALQFQSILKDAGIRTFIRESHGADISAACGQLRLYNPP